MPGAPRKYERPRAPIPGQDGPCGFKARLAAYVAALPDDLEIEYVREWLPGEERFTVDWREQARRIKAGEPYDLTITIRPKGAVLPTNRGGVPVTPSGPAATRHRRGR